MKIHRVKSLWGCYNLYLLLPVKSLQVKRTLNKLTFLAGFTLPSTSLYQFYISVVCAHQRETFKTLFNLEGRGPRTETRVPNQLFLVATK